jgi:hypothetical protein
MSIASSKSGLFEEHTIPTEGNDRLFAMTMMPKRPRRVVFMAPLIGAGAAQAPMTFRNMTRHGCVLLSFQYRGHPRCTGTFTLDRTIVDTRHALIWAWNYASERGLPLHALTQCYGTIPLLAQFAQGGCGTLVKSISLGSALVRMDQIIQIGDFVPFLSRRLGRKLDIAGLREGLAEHTFDWKGPACREALFEYLSQMFPELRVTWDSFEELSYDRADLGQTLLQFMRARYLHGITVPSSIPCHLFLGHRDEMMNLHTPQGREVYENNVRMLIPHAVPHYYDIDHFGRGPGREPLIEVMADVCEQSETPLAHMHPARGTPHFGVHADEATASLLD